ncbi:hypothetical protein NQ318_001743 [Aromia moschata]|uniref:Uncharacterized protein n=1 Tax=Aromia moschata TaxID=1265417 RepID=A0AAV8XS48_9CUCU|nr:hypothetical protein NQ318_001743 [Aromia moschata]
MLLKNLEKSDQASVALQENIKTLQDHLGIYKTQYSDFETTMQKSNKESPQAYRMRWQSCTNSLVQVTEMQQQASVELKRPSVRSRCSRKAVTPITD